MGSEMCIRDRNYIDQINGKFEVFLENNLTYSYKRKDGLLRAGLEYLQSKNDEGELELQSCTFSLKEWKSTDTSLPSVHYKFENLR